MSLNTKSGGTSDKLLRPLENISHAHEKTLPCAYVETHTFIAKGSREFPSTALYCPISALSSLPFPIKQGKTVLQNIVGYQTGTTGQDNNFVVIPFLTAGHNTADIQSIKISDGGAGTIGWGGELFSIWEGVPTVVNDSEYFYYDPSADPAGAAKDYYWGDADGNKVAFSVDNGQGVVVNCSRDLKITTSGQVSDAQVTFKTAKDNNFTGNPFPVPLDIQKIKISDGGAGTIGWGGELFSIWEGAVCHNNGHHRQGQAVSACTPFAKYWTL